MSHERPAAVDKLPPRPLSVDEGQALEQQESSSSWVRPESILFQDDDDVVVALLAVDRDAGHAWLVGYSPDEAGWVVVDDWSEAELDQDVFTARLQEWERETFAGRDGWILG